MIERTLNRRIFSWCAIAVACMVSDTARASDHSDTLALVAIARHDARLTDLHAFRRGDMLVLALCSNPTVPTTATSYIFPSDLELTILIDNDSEVRVDDAGDLADLGGTIVDPKHIHEDITFNVSFDDAGTPRLKMKGLHKSVKDEVLLFAGLRDDPFIRGPRQGRNVAAVVLQVPLDRVVSADLPTLLIWAVSRVPDAHGRFQDLAGRALRSQFPENDAMNTKPPRQHEKKIGLAPDVMIYDTSRSAAFPNGRELADDVVDLVGDARVLADDAPFPNANDVPFLTEFPYLAPPHAP